MLYLDIKKRLSRFDLHIRLETDGKITGVFGASGAGKSMTLKCIAGIEKPDSGVIRLNGKVLYDSEKRINLRPQERGVGYLFQEYALFPNMTVKGNILAGLHRMKHCDRGAAAVEIMEQFRIAHLSEKRPDLLSGGEKQRVALARIFASSPEVILLDEPFSSLDTVLKCELIPMMKEAILSYGKGCLMVSHDAAELTAICDKVTTISQGRNTEPVPAEDFMHDLREQFESISHLQIPPQ